MKTSMTLSNLIFIAATLATGLVAGLFYGYQVSVNKGLGALTDLEYLKAMQSINQVILNPLFFVSFMGALILLPINTYLQYQLDTRSFFLFLGATLLYILGTFGVTIFGNVPLNNQLATFDWQNATPEAIKAMRLQFEGPWNNLHTIRTICSIIALLLLLLGITTRIP